MRTLAIILLTASFLGGCKSSERAQIFSLGSRHHITCYSGGKVIYEGYSPGNVSNEDRSDGWYWEDEKTGKLVEVTAPCVIEQL
jgi:hypothetical protein